MKYCPPREGNTENQLFLYHPTLEHNKEIKNNHKNYILSVLGLDSRYTVKYSPLHLEVPSGKGLYLTVYPLSCPSTDTV